MIENNNKPYIVYSHRLMRHLGDLGFTPFATAPNTKYPNKVVFIYNNTAELIDAIEKYLENNKRAD